MLPDLVHWGRIDLVRAMLRVRSVIEYLIDLYNVNSIFYVYWICHIADRLKLDDLLDDIRGLIGRGSDRLHSGLKFWE